MKAMIWDFNGVIIDDEHIHRVAFDRVLSQLGLRLTEAEYFERYLGLSDWTMLSRSLTDKRGTAPAQDEVDALVKTKGDVYLELIADGFELIDGAPELVRAVAAHVPMAVNSGARRIEVETILERSDLRRYFKAIVTADDVERGKPDPQGYLRAAELLGIAAADCVVIEDAPPGIVAAHAAGMKCVAVTTGQSASALSEAELVVAGPAALTAERLLQL